MVHRHRGAFLVRGENCLAALRHFLEPDEVRLRDWTVVFGRLDGLVEQVEERRRDAVRGNVVLAQYW